MLTIASSFGFPCFFSFSFLFSFAAQAAHARKYQQLILKHQMEEKALAKRLEAGEERRFADRVKADQELCDGWERRTQLMKKRNNKHYVHALKSQIAARDMHRQQVSQ